MAESETERRGVQGRHDYVVIREIYEHVNAQEDFELELERALEAKIKHIIIEPAKLGDETSRWIRVGNSLHKSAVVSGLVSLITIYGWPDKSYIYMPLGCISVICSGVYAISWQFDPCCKYQVEYNIRKLEKLPLYKLSSTAPVVLVRRDDTRRKFLQNVVSFAAASFCAWKLYDWYFR